MVSTKDREKVVELKKLYSCYFSLLHSSFDKPRYEKQKIKTLAEIKKQIIELEKQLGIFESEII